MPTCACAMMRARRDRNARQRLCLPGWQENRRLRHRGHPSVSAVAGLLRLGRAQGRTEAELAEMEKQFGLHELAVEDASHGHQRPKLEEYENLFMPSCRRLSLREGDLHSGRSESLRGREFRAVGSLPHPPRIRRCAGALRARAALAQARPGIRLLCAHRRDRRSLFPSHRRARAELERLERRMFADDRRARTSSSSMPSSRG